MHGGPRSDLAYLVACKIGASPDQRSAETLRFFRVRDANAQPFAMTHIRFGACRLDLDGRRLYRDEQEVHITPKAYDLLRVLIDNRERALAKAELSERI